MSTTRTSRLLRASLVAAATLLGACADSPVGPSAVGTTPRLALAEPHFVTTPSPTGAADALLACPSAVTASATAVIGRKGGVVRVAGSELSVTPGAVDEPTAFTLVVPASPVMEIEIHAAGVPHFQFKHPVAVTIDYSRCAASALPAKSLSAWYIDSATQGQIALMHAVDDRASRRLTFRTNHLSGYAAAY